jgi:hypothetical protein
MNRLALSLLLLVALPACSKGTCIFEKESESKACFVNYRESPCADQKARYEKVSGEKGVLLCLSAGYTVPTKTGGFRMSEAEVKTAIDKGEMIQYARPTLTNTRLFSRGVTGRGQLGVAHAALPTPRCSRPRRHDRSVGRSCPQATLKSCRKVAGAG